MSFLVNNLSFIIGDLVPKNSQTWKLYVLSRRQMTSSIMTPALNESMIGELELLIVNHHKSYKNLTKQSLKPKHHHLLHYVRLFKLSGPSRNFLCMRFEAKHSYFWSKYISNFSEKAPAETQL